MTTKAKATIHDLAALRGDAKAEIVNGEVVLMSPTGSRPARASFNTASSLRGHEKRGGQGFAFGDNVGFVVHLPNRDSFSPDAAWYVAVLSNPVSARPVGRS